MIGMLQAALDELMALPSDAQGHPSVLKLLCSAHAGLGNPDQASPAADALIQAGDPSGYEFKANLYMCKGQHHDAYQLLRLVIERFPDRAFMHYELARAAAACAIWSEARHWLFAAIRIQRCIKEVALSMDVFGPIREEIAAMNPSD